MKTKSILAGMFVGLCAVMALGAGVRQPTATVKTFLDTPTLTNFGSLVSDEGTGVIAALQTNVGSAGAVVVNGGAGGTPSSLNLTNASSLPAAGVTNTAATLTDTQTLTNKRITPRVTSITSHATPTINTDSCDCVTITAQAEAITSMTTNLSGTPTNFQKLIIRIKDNGTARAITWGSSFEAKGVALPTTTVLSKVLTVGFIYDTVTSKWGCVASAQES